MFETTHQSSGHLDLSNITSNWKGRIWTV